MVVQPSFSLQSSVLSGLSPSQSLGSLSSILGSSCRTGNCTWDPVDSLAVCSACTDTSEQLVRKDEVATSQHISISEGAAPPFFGNATEYRLPNDVYLSNFKGPAGPFMIRMVTGGTGDPSRTLTFRNNDLLIWALTVINTTYDASKPVDWPNVPVNANECGLYYCVNRYTSVVANGTLYETAVPVSAARSKDSWQVISSQLKTPLNNSLEYNRAASVPRTDLQIGDGFNVSHTAVIAMNYYLSSIFTNGGGVIDTEGDGDPETFEYSPSAMQALWDTSDLNKTFAHLATSLSYNIRANSNGKQVVTGRTGDWVTLVRVRWAWLVLPILLELAAIVFLALVAFSSHKLKIALWKSSSLPILLCGPQVAEILWDAQLVSEMGKRAEDAKWQLE